MKIIALSELMSQVLLIIVYLQTINTYKEIKENLLLFAMNINQ